MEFSDLIKGKINAEDLKKDNNNSNRIIVKKWCDLIRLFEYFNEFGELNEGRGGRWIFRGEKIKKNKKSLTLTMKKI